MVRIFGNIITPGEPTVKTSLRELYEAVRSMDKKNIKSVKRVVVVDGCNYLNKIGNKMWDMRNDNIPNARAALHLIHWLYSMGFEVHFILKKFYVDNGKRKPLNVINPYILEHLSRRDVGIIEFLPDDQDDDSVILDRARQLKGFVISNDKYRQYKGFEDVPVIQVSFDPHFNMNINLTQYLLFTGRYLTNIDIQLDISAEQFLDVAYCKPNDPDFPVVSEIRAQLPLDYHEENLKQCNVLEEFYRMKMCEIAYERGLIMESPEYFNFIERGGEIPKFEDFYSSFRAHVPGRHFGQNNGE